MSGWKPCTAGEQKDWKAYKKIMAEPDRPLTLEQRKQFNAILRAQARRSHHKGPIPFMSENEDGAE